MESPILASMRGLLNEQYRKVRKLEEENKTLKEENKKMKDIINKIFYLYNEEPTELEEYVKSGFKGGMSN